MTHTYNARFVLVTSQIFEEVIEAESEHEANILLGQMIEDGKGANDEVVIDSFYETNTLEVVS